MSKFIIREFFKLIIIHLHWKINIVGYLQIKRVSKIIK